MNRWKTGWLVLFTIVSPNLVRANELDEKNVRPNGPAGETAQILGFERRQFQVERVRGKVWLNGRLAPDDVVENNPNEIQLIEVFDGLSFQTTADFQRWVRKLRGARTYTYDVVHWREANGILHQHPLVLLPDHQRQVADIAWQRWRADEDAAAAAVLAAAEERKLAAQRNAALERLIAQQGEAIVRLAKEQSEQRSRPRRGYAVTVFPGSLSEFPGSLPFGSNTVFANGLPTPTITAAFGNGFIVNANGLGRVFGTNLLTR